MRIKTTHAMVLATLCLLAAPLFSSGVSGAVEETPGVPAIEAPNIKFPTIDEILSTVEFPDYDVMDFFDDLFGLGEALSETESAIGGFKDFIMEDTFINPEVGTDTLSSKFFAICLAIMIICILMAVVSLFVYKRENA